MWPNEFTTSHSCHCCCWSFLLNKQPNEQKIHSKLRRRSRISKHTATFQTCGIVPRVPGYTRGCWGLSDCSSIFKSLNFRTFSESVLSSLCAWSLLHTASLPASLPLHLKMLQSLLTPVLFSECPEVPEIFFLWLIYYRKFSLSHSTIFFADVLLAFRVFFFLWCYRSTLLLVASSSLPGFSGYYRLLRNQVAKMLSKILSALCYFAAVEQRRTIHEWSNEDKQKQRLHERTTAKVKTGRRCFPLKFK